MMQQLFKVFLLQIIMETQKIANLLGDVDNKSLKFATKKGMLLMIKKIQTMAMEKKTVSPLNLKLKSLNQIFVIIQTHIFL